MQKVGPRTTICEPDLNYGTGLILETRIKRDMLFPPRTDFSIGICAADNAPRIYKLLELLETETFPSEFELEKIVIVASGCELGLLDFVRRKMKSNERMALLEGTCQKGQGVCQDLDLRSDQSERGFCLSVQDWRSLRGRDRPQKARTSHLDQYPKTKRQSLAGQRGSEVWSHER